MKKRILRQGGVPLLAACLTFVLFLLFFALYGLYPAGNKSVVWCDMEQQAVPLLVQFKQMAARGESISFSALNAGGMTFYGVFFFFLSNPLSLLVLLCDIPADMLVNLLVIMKLALAAGTAAIWLRYRVPELPAAPQILLAMMYGCSGYGLFYYQNLMWLDIMVMLPLLFISLHILFRKQNPLPYFLTLCMTMLLCFYLCYMIVLYVLIAASLAVRFLVPAEQRGKTARCLWGASFTAACLTAVIWLPCFTQVMRSARSDGLIAGLMNTYLVNHLPDKLSLLGCTAMGFAVLPVLWLRGKQKDGQARYDRAMLLLLTAAMLLDPVNAMWHTGSYQAFPLRWGMIPLLLLLTYAARRLVSPAQADGKPPRKSTAILVMCIAAAVCGGTAAAMIFFAGDRILSYIRTLWVDETSFFLLLIPILLLAVSYGLCLHFCRRKALSVRVGTVFLSLLFCAEFALNFHCYMGKAADEDALFGQTMDAAGRITDDSFYRLRMTKKYGHVNMVGALGYPTLSHYTSMTREDFMHGVKRMGYSSYWMEVTGTGGTVLSDAVWNIRYLLGQSPDWASDVETVWTNSTLSIGKRGFRLPGAVLTDAQPEDIAALPEGKRADVQRALAKQYLGLDDCVTEYPVTAQHGCTVTTEDSGHTVCRLDSDSDEGIISFAFFVSGRQSLYFDLYTQTGNRLYNPRNGAGTVMLNGRTIRTPYPENNTNGLVWLCDAENEYVSVRFKAKKDFTCESFGVFGLDLVQLEDAAQTVRGAEIQYHGGTYSTEIQADKPGTVILSAAYDEGFTAEVNGQPAAVYRVNDCMCAVRVGAGTNRITLKSHVQGLNTALLIAGFGLLCTALWYLLRGKLSDKLMRGLERVSAYGLQAAFLLILLGVYLMPVVLCIAGMIRDARLF